MLAKVFVVFQTNDRYHGDYRMNTLYFERPENLERVNLTIAGREADTLGSMDSDTISNGLLHFLYIRTCRTMEFFYRNQPPVDFTFANFKHHLFILGWDLTTTGSSLEGTLPLVKQGLKRIHLKFNAPCPRDYKMIVFATSPSKLSIDKERACSVSYTY